MALAEKDLRRIVEEVVAKSAGRESAATPVDLSPRVPGWPRDVPFPFAPVGVSNRHVHLRQEDVDALFGPGHKMTPFRELKQPGQWASKETVTVVGPRESLTGVRMVGPVRKYTQVEVSMTDVLTLGVPVPPIRQSGELKGAGSVAVVGPKGCISVREGVILSVRHLHVHAEEAPALGLKDQEIVRVRIRGPRGATLENVVARVGTGHRLEMHLDTDEANAVGVTSGDLVEIIK